MELCQILYSDEYKDTMSALRDHLQNKIYTEEALQLTEEALELLASHYTTWQYRYTIIKHLKKDLFEELDWCELVALENEKNYQIWNYRQRIIDDILADEETASKFDYKRELPILRMMLLQDSKNHHVWSYRKWFVEKFGLFDNASEIEFVTGAIDADLRNNSAWTHRFFLRAKGSGFDTGFDDEVQFCQSRIDVCPQNPSSWNYLVGMYARSERKLGELKEFCEKYGDVTQDKIASSFAVETMAKIAVEEKNGDRARQLYEMLAEKYDPIRANYWRYMKERV
ncbi:CIC11C00000003743 [Sungouiella intermedia]|uniref:Protein farnesyltransferase/geranylgeranyltransferase type-1 subunit alpha n=1 Tax=Sungouiella intermedia TaxID=45354 RepID=A0A1L0D3L9_9ASCO|nr:CIC11C00000003743 [[Candida] intermedia]